MDFDKLDRRILLTSLFAFALTAQSSFALTDEGTDGGGSSGKQLRVGAGGAGSSGAPHGPPEGRHTDGEEHEDDHADDGHEDGHEDGHGEDGTEGEEHESDHVSGGKGKGPRYRGGRESGVTGVSHARSLEDRVLRKEPF